jgi:hypothetical protein
VFDLPEEAEKHRHNLVLARDLRARSAIAVVLQEHWLVRMIGMILVIGLPLLELLPND